MTHFCIFDLDGTLVNSLADLADATNDALRRQGFPTHPVEAYRHFVGDGILMLLRRAAPEGVSPRHWNSCIKGLMRITPPIALTIPNPIRDAASCWNAFPKKGFPVRSSPINRMNSWGPL